MSDEGAGLSASDLRALYQSTILAHNRTPRNRGRVAEETSRARGANPLCGDEVTVSLCVKEGVVVAAGFEGKSCAICTAAASCMTEVSIAKTPQALELLSARFEAVMTGASGASALAGEELLEAFIPVSGFPSRIKCAILPWRALSQALSGEHEVVTTEGVQGPQD